MPEINFSEKELEDFLSCKRNLKKHLGLRFLARQYRTPVGVVDMIAYNNKTKRFVIIELKKDTLDTSSYFQIERYRHFFVKKADNLWNKKCDRRYSLQKKGVDLFLKVPTRYHNFDCLLVGKSLSKELDYVVEKWEASSYRSDYSRVWYTCFAYSFEKAISFAYHSVSQKEVEDNSYEE